jgi:drug/metabolite transporter (DMT)-like permease
VPAVLLLVLATLFWAGNYLVGEWVVDTVDPLSLTWLRWALAAGPLVLLAHLVERPRWPVLLGRWRVLLLVGLGGAAAYPLLLYAALERTSAVNASVINAANPAAIVVASVLLGQARAGWRSWAGVALGLVGVTLVLTEGDPARLLALRFNTGDLLMLGAVLAWTAYTLAGRRLGLPVLAATAVQVVLTTLALTPFVLYAGIRLPVDGTGWWAVAFIAAFPSLGAYLCWNLAVPRVTPGTAAASMNLVTVFTVAAATLLGRPPDPVQVVGGALVIGGVLLSTTERGRSRIPDTAPPDAPGPRPARPLGSAE